MPADEVGVVIPAYDAAAYLPATLDGVLSQSVPVAECIVVDDGSSDGTATVAEAAGDPVRVVRQENRGVSAARNRGVREVSTGWVAFCDADDVWLPEKLERQLESMRKAPRAVAALTGAVRVGPDGTRLGGDDAEPRPEELTLCGLVHHRPAEVPVSIPSTLLAPHEVLVEVGPWDETLSDAADWDYLIRLRKLGILTGPVEPLVRYRQHPGAMSGDVAGRARDIRRLFEKLARDPEIRSRCGGELAAAWGWQVTVLSASYWRAGRPLASLGLLARELMRHPLAVSGAIFERVTS